MRNVSICATSCNNEKVKNKLSDFEFLFFIFISIDYLLPAVSSAIPFILILTVCTGYTCFLCLLSQKEPKFYLTILIIATLFSFLYCILTNTSSIQQDVSNYVLKRILSKFNQAFMSFFPIIMFLEIQKKASYAQKKWLLIVITVALSYVLINTMVELSVNESATRNWAEFDEQSEKNVGTYSYVYAVPILFASLPYLFVQMRNSFLKFLIVGIGIFLFSFLLLAQYTLALLIAIIGLVLQISFNIKSNKTKIILWLCCILVFLALPTILDYLATHVPSEQMAIRLQEIASFFGKGDASGYNLNGRLKLYGETLKAFLRSPIIGNRSLGFDGHSTFLSVLADVGIFGGIPFLYLYFASRKKINKNLGNSNKIFTPVFISLMLMGLTNPIHSAFQLSFVVWFVVPLIIVYCKKKEKDNETTLGN